MDFMEVHYMHICELLTVITVIQIDVERFLVKLEILNVRKKRNRHSVLSLWACFQFQSVLNVIPRGSSLARRAVLRWAPGDLG